MIYLPSIVFNAILCFFNVVAKPRQPYSYRQVGQLILMIKSVSSLGLGQQRWAKICQLSQIRYANNSARLQDHMACPHLMFLRCHLNLKVNRRQANSRARVTQANWLALSCVTVLQICKYGRPNDMNVLQASNFLIFNESVKLLIGLYMLHRLERIVVGSPNCKVLHQFSCAPFQKRLKCIRDLFLFKLFKRLRLSSTFHYEKKNDTIATL